jgi:S1-C subfamily serine protease
VDIDATIDARVQQALQAMPTVTPQPTATPQAIPTPLPTATPAPVPTPQPTATPARTATPQPTATLVPTSTPQPELGATPTPITLPGDLYADLRRSVVRVRNGDSYGSGWPIEEGWIITNAHVVGSSSTVSVEVPLASGGIVTRTGTVRGIDTKRDLAAVQVNHGAPVLPTRILTAEDAGEQVVQLGYSVTATGGFPAIHVGVVAAVIRHLGFVLDDAPARADLGNDTGGVSVVVFDAAADPGDSGGPVVDMEGNVVAITFGAVVTTGSGKRVLGQQQGTGIESINAVWTQLKNGTNTTSL